MLTSLEAAKMCRDSYTGESAGWDKWYDLNGIVAGLRYTPEGTHLVFRGSDCKEDWKRDFDMWPTYHLRLGFVHGGFIEGMDGFYDAVRRDIRGTVEITGHSLGAARGCLMAGLLDARPAQLIVFGCPRPGFAKARSIVTANCDKIVSYRNRIDPVPEVPWLMGMYKHVVDLTHVDSKVDTIEPFDDHSIEQYITALSLPPK